MIKSSITKDKYFDMVKKHKSTNASTPEFRKQELDAITAFPVGTKFAFKEDNSWHDVNTVYEKIDDDVWKVTQVINGKINDEYTKSDDEVRIYISDEFGSNAYPTIYVSGYGSINSSRRNNMIKSGLAAFNRAIEKKYMGTSPNGAGQYYLDWRYNLADEKDYIEQLADKNGLSVEFQSDEGYFEVFSSRRNNMIKSELIEVNDPVLFDNMNAQGGPRVRKVYINKSPLRGHGDTGDSDRVALQYYEDGYQSSNTTTVPKTWFEDPDNIYKYAVKNSRQIKSDYHNKEIYREAFASLIEDSPAQDFDISPYGTAHYPGFYRVLVDGTYETEFSAETREEAIQKFKDYFDNKKQIKSDYDYWHRTPLQIKFDSSFNSWFSHFQMNDDMLPEFKEGFNWFEHNKNKPWMDELREKYHVNPVGDREIAAFYNALKSVGAINQWGQPLNNSRQIKSGKYFVQVNTDDKVLFDTLQEANISYMQAVENNTPDDYITIGETDGNRIIQYDSSRGMLNVDENDWHAKEELNSSRQIKSSPDFKKYTADEIFDYFDISELTNTVFMDREQCKANKCGMEEFTDLMWNVAPTWLGIQNPDDVREVCRRAKNPKAKAFLEAFETAMENAKFTDKFYNSVTVHKKRNVQSSREEIDETAARELAICTVNDGDVQPRIKAIIKNLSRKKKNGTYDDSLAAKAFLIAVEDEAKIYDKQFGSGRGSLTMFNKPTRMRAAEIVKEHYDEDIQ